ncbi:hypothetical protein BBAD15_g9751 [Beauveria bassiana D1-5]|uniref:Uncharacterized protein n=1 Tax=Beauveria bassiana D1-5 TaxID=1245745 RepID=A0A0A2VW50_BEABA|nr:hypothetical protein BBAD15_g9751 [Beauveria bassiana D1-5]
MGTAHHTQTAIVGDEDAELVLYHAAPIPLITDDVVLVQNKAVAVNPVDTKMVGLYATAGAIAGGDFAVFKSVGVPGYPLLENPDPRPVLVYAGMKELKAG